MADNQTEPVGGPPQLVDAATAKRIDAAVRQVETYWRNRPPVSGRSPRGNDSPMQKAVTGVSGIGAATSATAPTGASVTLCTWDGDSWVATSETVTAYNPSTAGAVPGSTYITIGWVSGMWEVVLEPC